ncbi:sulfatase-like hydrolase/transferase [Halomonas llamarensis]|uniref:Sulfatase-like hydrolase/transferase n=1 Tax=Halomonas llamarensis TaxID=2945104 RepID=A0ABT0SUH5_9GAMM|nr:sulfatase-like hydrolase/transferase [Halomonas llamarensis]MCL7931396.1 sulfatase-like hydrolase/transferase [Halomonas llamarensis]
MPRLTLPQPSTWMPIAAISLSLGYTIATLTSLPWWSLFLFAAAGVWLGTRFHLGQPRFRRYRKVWPWSLLPLCLWGLYVYLADSFGKLDLGAVFFHLQAGMSDHGGTGRMVAAAVYTLCMLGVLLAFTWLTRNDWRWRRVDPLLAVILIASNPLILGLGQRSAVVVTDDGGWLERRYVTPRVQAQDDPPNLVLLYLESIERTYGAPVFGDAYDDLEALGERGVVFEGIRQIANTGWTMAGMIASQCGTPLMPAGLLHDRQFEPLSAVVPGVNCLGDVLSEQGYRLTYLGGASIEFAGKGLFYNGHGFQNVYGLKELQPQLDDETYVNDWGLFDDTLYEFTLNEIERLEAESDSPWGIVNLSITGHAPSGYPARRCRERQGEWDGEDILYSVECSAWLARDFVERLEAKGLLDNTVVAIVSDHLTMRVSAWDTLETLPRENTFILLGNDLEPQHISREASTLDIFPTLLDALGYPAKNHQAGLGASLLDDTTSTLLERHGEEAINRRLHEESALQQRLWDGLSPHQHKTPPRPKPAEQGLENPSDSTDEINLEL